MMIMQAAKSLSEYQQAAAARWPHYRIHGDGPHALICPGSYSITLYSYWLEAATAMMADHANWRCKDSHKLEEIKPAPRRVPVPRGFAERMERD